MTTLNRSQPFNKTNVRMSPRSSGVYFLFKNGQLVNIGKAAKSTIRARLLSHLSGMEGSCTKAADHFNYETCGNPATKEKALLMSYRRKYGRLPLCNKIMP